MTPTPQEFKPSDYQAALDAVTGYDNDLWFVKHFGAIKSALTRCATEPVGEVMEAEEFCSHLQMQLNYNSDLGWTYVVYEIEERDEAIRQSERAKAGELVKALMPLSNVASVLGKNLSPDIGLWSQTTNVGEAVRLTVGDARNAQSAIARFTSSNAPGANKEDV